MPHATRFRALAGDQTQSGGIRDPRPPLLTRPHAFRRADQSLSLLRCAGRTPRRSRSLLCARRLPADARSHQPRRPPFPASAACPFWIAHCAQSHSHWQATPVLGRQSGERSAPRFHAAARLHRQLSGFLKVTGLCERTKTAHAFKHPRILCDSSKDTSHAFVASTELAGPPFPCARRWQVIAMYRAPPRPQAPFTGFATIFRRFRPPGGRPAAPPIGPPASRRARAYGICTRKLLCALPPFVSPFFPFASASAPIGFSTSDRFPFSRFCG